MSDKEILKADFELGFTYTRSTGPVIGHFLTELQKCKIYGIKGSDGKVIVPPAEYDPVTGETLKEFIEVSDSGGYRFKPGPVPGIGRKPLQSHTSGARSERFRAQWHRR